MVDWHRRKNRRLGLALLGVWGGIFALSLLGILVLK